MTCLGLLDVLERIASASGHAIVCAALRRHLPRQLVHDAWSICYHFFGFRQVTVLCRRDMALMNRPHLYIQPPGPRVTCIQLPGGKTQHLCQPPKVSED